MTTFDMGKYCTTAAYSNLKTPDLADILRIMQEAKAKIAAITAAPQFRYLILDNARIEELRKAIDAPEDSIAHVNETSFLGISIIQEDDPHSRHALAISLSAASGQPAAYEDENGNLRVVDWSRSAQTPRTEE